MVNMVTAFRQQAHRQHRGDRFSRAGFAHHADNFTRPISSETWLSAWTSPRKMGKLRCKSSIDNTESLMTASLPDLGSSRSRRPSPNRLNPTAVIRIAAPETRSTTTGQARTLRPTATIAPHSAVGCCAPNPIKPSVAAIRMALPISSDACTISGGRALRRICQLIRCQRDAPKVRAACT